MSFIPIIKDLVPMILPSQIHITPVTSLVPELEAGNGQKEGMARRDAIVGKSDKICASDHHGEQETIIYASSGHGALISDGGKNRNDLPQGSFAHIPAWTEHQEINDSDEEVTWIITRSGGEPVVVNLEGWGGGVVKA